MNTLETPQGSFSLNRFPLRKKQPLRAWDAADEYLLHYLAENGLLVSQQTGAGQSGGEQKPEALSLLLVNDGFGALAIALNAYHPVVMNDSYISFQAISQNARNNQIDESSFKLINSLDSPAEFLQEQANIVLIKLPKSLAMLEDQLYRMRSIVNESTVIIAAGMTKHIHLSTMAVFEKVMGPTTTSLARKKARLIFCQADAKLEPEPNPYPCCYKSGYKLDGKELEICNHAAVFSREKLDIGTRFFIENLPVNESYHIIVDLGCGNGILGLLAAVKNPAAKILFTDESAMAIDSAIKNFISVFSETREAEFLQTDCLQGIDENSVSAVLCNPPFHQNNAVNDDIAWQMFVESKAILEDNGELWVIGNRHLAYHAKLKHLFGACDVVASNKKFVVYKAIKKR